MPKNAFITDIQVLQKRTSDSDKDAGTTGYNTDRAGVLGGAVETQLNELLAPGRGFHEGLSGHCPFNPYSQVFLPRQQWLRPLPPISRQCHRRFPFSWSGR